MKRIVLLLALVAAVFAFRPISASAQAGTVVFNSIPDPMPPNVPSEGFQCCQNSALGDEITLEPDTPRLAGYATVLMSSWSLFSHYPGFASAGYNHPITLNIYQDASSAALNNPAKSVTQSFLIPWRPAEDPSCPILYEVRGWKAGDGKCYNGYAFTIVFDLTSLGYSLPDTFIYGVAFNTNSWGYDPINHPGPYESLNVGTSNVGGVAIPPSVGTDVQPDVVFRSAGVGGPVLPEGDWNGYEPAVTFSTIAFPVVTSDCKNGAWKNLVRSDFTPFKNQGVCVSYVNTGR
jgi:hypothetical protein